MTHTVDDPTVSANRRVKPQPPQSITSSSGKLLARHRFLRQADVMPFQQVRPHDRSAVEQLTRISNAAQEVDDPEEPPEIPELASLGLVYGWDLEPNDTFLYTPDGASAPVGVLATNAPERDNRHVMTGNVVVHPRCRRLGHGSAMITELIRRTTDIGRNTIWVGCAEDDDAAAAFLKRHGFSCASHEARRYQRLADLDHPEMDRRYVQAEQAACDYDLVRLRVPTDAGVLAELVEVTAAINDAPTGELDIEDEKFDLSPAAGLRICLPVQGRAAVPGFRPASSNRSGRRTHGVGCPAAARDLGSSDGHRRTS